MSNTITCPQTGRKLIFVEESTFSVSSGEIWARRVYALATPRRRRTNADNDQRVLFFEPTGAFAEPLDPSPLAPYGKSPRGRIKPYQG